MAIPKIPGDRKLIKMVCYMLRLKVTRFQLPTPNGFWAVLKKKTAGGGKFTHPPVQNRVKKLNLAILIFYLVNLKICLKLLAYFTLKLSCPIISAWINVKNFKEVSTNT